MAIPLKRSAFRQIVGRYLKDLFARLPSAKITEIKQFTPSEWVGEKSKKK